MARDTDLPGEHTEAIHPPSSSKGFSTNKALPRPPAKFRHTDPRIRPVELVDDEQYIFYSSTLATSAVVLSVAAFNPYRRYLMLQNTGTLEILLGFGVNPILSTNFAQTQAIRLPAGTMIDFPARIVPTNDIFAVSSAASSLAILEGIKAP